VEKQPLSGKFSKFCSKKIIATPIDVLCANLVKFALWKIGEVVRYLPDKKNKISPRSPALATARIALKICQQCTQSAPDFIHIASQQFLWSYTRKHERRQSGP